MQSIGVSLARGADFGKEGKRSRAHQTGIWATTAPSGDRCGQAQPRFPREAQSPFLQIPQFASLQSREPKGDRLKANSGTAALLWDPVPIAVGFGVPLLPSRSPRAHHSLVAAPDPAVTKAGQGRQKRGEEQQEMEGRARL